MHILKKKGSEIKGFIVNVSIVILDTLRASRICCRRCTSRAGTTIPYSKLKSHTGR